MTLDSTTFRSMLFVLLSLVCACPEAHAALLKNGSQPTLLATKSWVSHQQTSERDTGRATFLNDCIGQAMFVELQKDYGVAKFVLNPGETQTHRVSKGDVYATRCGFVVSRSAPYYWILLDSLAH
jgi:hypothetical protein